MACNCDFDTTGYSNTNDLGYCCDDGYTSDYEGACGCNEFHEVWSDVDLACVCSSGFERNSWFECCPENASYDSEGECYCDDYNAF
jgi:hypothetical protein